MIFQIGAAEDNTEVVEKLSKNIKKGQIILGYTWGSKCENIP